MDSKTCQPTCGEQFPVLRQKHHKNRLTDHYLKHQPKELANYVKNFQFHYSDLRDEEMILLNDMSVDRRDVCSQHNFNVGRTLQNLHVTLKPIVELKSQPFYGLCGLPNFFSRLRRIRFGTLIKKKQAITYIDDTIMQSQNKNKFYTAINETHTLRRKAAFKAAPD